MKTSTKVLMACGVVAAGYGIGSFVHWSNKEIVTTEYVFRSEDLPEEFRGYRICNVSDLQSEYFGENQSKLLEAVRRAEPDLIVITGDLVDRNHTNFTAAIKAVSGLLKIAPVCYVNGNHELRLPQAKIQPFYEELRMMGVSVLFDSCKKIESENQFINIMGVSEESVFAAKEIGWELGRHYEPGVLLNKLAEICEKKEEGYTVMLVHEPQYLEEYASTGAQLILAGHAHGGQFRLPGGQGILSPGQGLLPKLTSGLHRQGSSTLCVSRGLGNSIFPLRLNNRPEIVVVKLG